MSRWQASLDITWATGNRFWRTNQSEVRLSSGLKTHWESKSVGQPTFRSPLEIIHYQTEYIFQQFSSDIRFLVYALFSLMEDPIMKISMMSSTSPTDSSRSSSTEESQGGELKSFPVFFHQESARSILYLVRFGLHCAFLRYLCMQQFHLFAYLEQNAKLKIEKIMFL